jgi:uncharacterized membrane protein
MIQFKGGKMKKYKQVFGWIILAAILGIYTWFQISLWDYPRYEIDMVYLYQDGYRILNGENPYSRILQGDMYQNNKYTTFFPAFIELSYLSQKLRYNYYEAWLYFWQRILLIVNLCITGLVFYIFLKKKSLALATFFALLWALNRWTLYMVQVRDIGFIAIFFLLLSFLLLPKNRWLALLSFSLSLAIKQIAIFLLPLYLIYIYHESPGKKWKEGFLAAAVILSIPLLTSLPFIFWDLKGFTLSILFSLTRSQWQHLPPVNSFDMLLNLSGFPARLPMLFLMFLVIAAAWKKRIRITLASMLVMATFVCLNSILFSQYMPWFIIFLPLTVYEMMSEGQAGILSYSA